MGEIRDQAGNSTDYGAGGEARDGLPPRLTVRRDLALSRDETTITVESDEALSQAPVIELATQISGAGALDSAIERASVEAIATWAPTRRWSKQATNPAPGRRGRSTWS